MRKLFYPLLVCLALMLTACTHDVTEYVNPFVGTDLHGHTYPGAIYPFGMIQPGPDTRLEGWDGCSAYHYSDDTLYGFSHTHLSGTGCEDFGDILVMPFVGDMTEADLHQKNYRSHFSHKKEHAEPGYYSVTLDKNNVQAELTAVERIAYHRYSFKDDGKKGLVIDLTHRDKTLSCDVKVDGNMITGYRNSSAWSPRQKCYFAIKSSEEIKSVDYFRAQEGVVVDESEHAYAVVYFDEAVESVELAVAISAVDANGALVNLTSHTSDFDQSRDDSHKAWVKELSRIEVEGGSKEDRTNFNTALYHCFTAPYLFSDADGRYRGQNDSIYTCDKDRNVYTVFSLWDTYRALHPLLNIIDRKRTSDFIYTFAKCYESGGELPMWELAAHETHCMIGYHACPVILDAKKAGIIDEYFAGNKAHMEDLLMQAMIATSNRTEAQRTYGQMGYLSSEDDNESVSKTLEYAFDDWCIHQFGYNQPQFAKYDLETYARRSLSWMNIMDQNGFMHARRNGGFVTPFSPSEVNNHFTEANSYQYSTYVPHHLKEYFALHGGNENAEQFLDSLFHTKAKLEGRDQSDIDGLIGQYAHGNEPSHHASYLYCYLGSQWKTAELVRQICLDFYTSRPDGLIGNEDCGQMSAWFVMSAMGFYAVCPGSDHYAIGSPLFDKVTIHLENGKDIVINARKQSHRNKYVKSLSVDGSATNCAFLSGEQLRNGCVLDFVMGSKPNREFGTEKIEDFLTSAEKMDARYQKGIPLSAPYFSRWEQRFNDSTSLEIHTNYPGECTLYYTTDGTCPTNASSVYSQAIPINGDCVIKAVAYSPTYGYSTVVEQHLTRFVADKKLTYVVEPDQQYRDSGEEGLIDRLYGTTNYRIGGWQGWQKDVELNIDLLQEKPVSSVGINCLSDCRSWVFFPQSFAVEYSLDGKDYQPLGELKNIARDAMSDSDWNYKEEGRQQSFTLKASATARYLKLKIKNYGALPSWHISAGQQAWLFIDEIEIQ